MAEQSFVPGNKQAQVRSPQSDVAHDDPFADLKLPRFTPSTPEKFAKALKENFTAWDQNGDGALSPNEARRAIYDQKYKSSDERIALQTLAKGQNNKTLSSFYKDSDSGVTLRDVEMFRAQEKVRDTLSFPERQKIADLRSALDNGAAHAEQEESTTMAFRKMAAHALKEFDNWDLDRDGFISTTDLTNYQAKHGQALSALDLACVSFLRSSLSNIQQLSNDEYGPENDGITRADMKQLEAAFVQYLSVEDRRNFQQSPPAPATPAKSEKLGYEIGADAMQTILRARGGTRRSNGGTGDPA